MASQLARVLLCAALLPLAACNNATSGARITAEKPAPVAVAKARTEPIFYNGKTYQFDMTPLEGGSYRMAVSGMTAKQEKDAVQLATSSLRYFACPDGKTGKLSGKPAYADGKWQMSASCV